MPTPLTFQQLDDWCNSIFDSYPWPYYNEMADYISILYHGGCRSTEPFDITRWAPYAYRSAYLQPLKGNNTRELHGAAMPLNFYNSIVSQATPFNGVTIYQFEHLFKKMLPLPLITTAEKKELFYPYRYRFVRQLKEFGDTDAEIAGKMGWTTTAMVSTYLSTELFYSGF